MTIKYERLEDEMGNICIKAEIGDGRVLLIPPVEENSDYQRYLRWIENPDAQETQGGIN